MAHRQEVHLTHRLGMNFGGVYVANVVIRGDYSDQIIPWRIRSHPYLS